MKIKLTLNEAANYITVLRRELAAAPSPVNVLEYAVLSQVMNKITKAFIKAEVGKKGFKISFTMAEAIVINQKYFKACENYEEMIVISKVRTESTH